MSKQIENNVVQMTFDNKDFEKNISTSTKSIEKLNEELKFKDASKGFQDLEKYANSVNFDGLNKAINNINSVFTVTGALTKKIIDDIAGYFETKIISAVSKVKNTVGYIMDIDLGIQKYEQFTTVMKTMQANLSDLDKERIEERKSLGFLNNELDYTQSYMDQLLLFTDETSYSFTDMANTMAKFASNNVGLEQATNAVQGLALAAAVAGQNATTANQAMMQISQSFAQGYVKYQDWQQAFGLKNIATKDLKETFINAALQAGTLDESDIAEAKRQLKGNWINWFYTSDKLNKEWLNISVLTSGLDKYSMASRAIFEASDKLTQESNISVSEITQWASEITKETDKSTEAITEFVKNLNYGAEDTAVLTELMLKLASAEYEIGLKAFIAGQQATNFHEAIDAVRDATGTKMLQILQAFIGDVDQASKLWTAFSNSLWTVFAEPLDNAVKGFQAWNKGLVDNGYQTVKLSENYEMFWNCVGGIFNDLGAIINKFLDEFRIFNGAFTEGTNGAVKAGSIIKKYTLDWLVKMTKGVAKLKENLDKFVKSDLLNNLVQTFKQILIIISNVKKAIGKLFQATIGTILENIGAPLEIISEQILKITTYIAELTERFLKSKTFNDILDVTTKLVTVLMKLATVVLQKLGNRFLSFLKSVIEFGIKLLNLVLPALESVVDFIGTDVIDAINALIDGPYGIGEAIDFLFDHFDQIIPKIEEFVKDITGMDFSDIQTKIKDFADDFIGHVKRMGSDGFDVLKQYFEENFDENVAGTLPNLFKVIAEADSLGAGAASTVNWVGDAVSRPIKLIFDLVGLLIGKDLSKMADEITSFIKSVTGALADLTPDLFEGLKWVVDIMLDVLEKVGTVVVNIVKYMAGFSDTTGYEILDKVLDAVGNLVTAILKAFTELLKGVGELITYMTPAALTAISWMKDFCQAIIDWLTSVFKSLKEVEDPDKFMDYAWKILKILIGLFIFAKIASFIGDVAFIFGSFGRASKLLAKSALTLADGVAGLTDTIGGYSFAGRLLYMSMMLISFSYALGKIVEAAAAFQDPELMKGAIAAMIVVIGLMVTTFFLISKVIDAQTSGYSKIQDALERKEAAEKKYNKLTKKHGKEGALWALGDKRTKDLNADIDQMREDEKLRTNSLLGVGGALLGTAVAIVAFGVAVNKLAKASKEFGFDNLLYAGITIAGIMLALGVFIKLVSASNKKSNKTSKQGGTTKTIKKQMQNIGKRGAKGQIKASDYVDTEEMTKTGDSEESSIEETTRTFKGLAPVLAALAGSVMVIASSIALLATVGNFVSGGAFAGAIIAVVLILGIIGAMVVLTTKFNKSKWYETGVLAFIIKAVGNAMLTIVLALAGLAFVLGNVVDKEGRGFITAIFGIIAFITAVLGAVAVLVTAFSKKGTTDDAAKAVKIVTKRLVSMMLLGTMCSAIAISIGGMVAGLVLLLNVVHEMNSGGKFSWYDFLAAAGVITLIIVGMYGFVTGLAKVLKGNDGDWKDSSAIIGGMIGIILASTYMLINIVAVIAIFAFFLSNCGVGPGSVVGAVVTIGAVLGMITLMIWALTSIAKATGGTNGDAGKTLLSIAGALLAISASVAVLGGALVGLAFAFSIFGDDMWRSLLYVGGVLVVVSAGIMVLALAAKIAGPAISGLAMGLGILTIALLGILVAVALFVVFGDLFMTYLEDALPTLQEKFFKIGESFGLMLSGLLQGINKHLPEILEALAELISTILTWLNENVYDWAILLFGVLLNLLAGLNQAISDNAEKIADELSKLVINIFGILALALSKLWEDLLLPIGKGIIDGLLWALGGLVDIILWPFKQLIKAIEKLFGIDSPSKVMAEIGGFLVQGLLKGVEGLADVLLAPFKLAAEGIMTIVDGIVSAWNWAVEAIDDKHNWKDKDKEMGENRAKEDKENFDSGVRDFANKAKGYYQQYVELTKKFSKARSEADRQAYRNQIKGLEESMKNLEGRYHSGAGATSMYKYMSENGMQATAGFLWAIRQGEPLAYSAGKDFSKYYDNGVKDFLGIHSPSETEKKNGLNAVAGFASGIKDTVVTAIGEKFGLNFDNGVINGITSMLGLDGLKDAMGLDGLTNVMGSEGTIAGLSYGEGMMDGFDQSLTNFDMSSATPDIGQLANYDTLTNLDGGNIDYTGQLKTTVTDRQLNQVSGAVSSSNDEIVKELKTLRTEMRSAFEAITQIQMYLDTGALVGEMVVPLDKELGKISNRKERRGI